MRIGIISDIHGNYKALKAVIADMKRNQMESIVVLGDLLFWGDEPQKCFDEIKKLEPIVWIKGNTDNWLNLIKEDFIPISKREEEIFTEFKRVKKLMNDESITFIRNLSEKKEIIIDNYKILCVHGSDRKIDEQIGLMTSRDELDSLFDRLDCDIMLCGHTHAPFSASKNGKIILNVGSVGMLNKENQASYGIIKLKKIDIEYKVRKIKY